ncbi:MAG: HNH endonuclease [Actinomycetota bacterium]|nr:HNH endonuclease [Actinomycetota bacterium]MDQ2956863.1 HNH endonuclease [Actinomycetota bacterium]
MLSTDFNLADWAHLPPLDAADLPAEPPPAREYTGGVTIGSELASVLFAEPEGVDLGAAMCQGLAAVHPGLVELARLGGTEVDALNPVERVDALIAVHRQQAWLEARKQELLAAIELKDRSDQHWCVEEVGAALGLPGGAARTALADAEQLTQRLPATWQALSGGQISGEQAMAITHGSYNLPDGLLPAFEARVLARAGEQSVTALKRSITRAVLALDPATAEQKHLRSVEDRHVRIAPAEHGMAWLIALLPADQAQSIYTRLHGAARVAQSEDGRSMDQLRADALIDGVLTGIDNGLPTEQGHQPRINVIVSLSTLLGKDEEPGWLDNYGPISAEHARRLAHDPTGSWRRLITDPVSGQLLDYGTTRYRPPRHLADHITARDGQCTFPFCTHTARTSDLDHLQPHPDGPTSATNLHPLHRRHHNAKTHAGWRPHRDERTGHTRWTSPQGRHSKPDHPNAGPLPNRRRFSRKSASDVRFPSSS